MLEGAILDLDGTLIDSDDVWLEVQTTLLESLGVKLTPKQRLALSGRGNLAAHFQNEFEISLSKGEINIKLWENYYSRQDKIIYPMPGALDSIDTLACRMPVGVATTNRTDYAERILEELGIRDRFQVVVGGDQVQRGKPSPDVYLEAAAQLQIDPRKCLSIEDSIHGVESAKAAGLFCIAIPGRNQTEEDFTPADCQIPNLEYLTALLQQSTDIRDLVPLLSGKSIFLAGNKRLYLDQNWNSKIGFFYLEKMDEIGKIPGDTTAVLESARNEVLRRVQSHRSEMVMVAHTTHPKMAEWTKSPEKGQGLFNWDDIWSSQGLLIAQKLFTPI